MEKEYTHTRKAFFSLCSFAFCTHCTRTITIMIIIKNIFNSKMFSIPNDFTNGYCSLPLTILYQPLQLLRLRELFFSIHSNRSLFVVHNMEPAIWASTITHNDNNNNNNTQKKEKHVRFISSHSVVQLMHMQYARCLFHWCTYTWHTELKLRM